MHFSKTSRCAAIGLTVVLGTGSAAHAATATEHFNDYGETRTDLIGRSGSETGWVGPWANNASPDYHPGVRLTYADPNYDNTPNGGNADDGAAGVIVGGGVNSGQVATRSFAAPLTGTVWVSALLRYTEAAAASPTVGEGLLWFDKTANATANFIAIRNNAGDGQAVLRYAGTDTKIGSFAKDTTHLLLARLTVGAVNDSISFWVDPNLSGGEAGLPAPTLSTSGADAYGPALEDIGVSFAYDGSFIDAIRVSNDADGFARVIPEPAGLSLLAMGGLLALHRRR